MWKIVLILFQTFFIAGCAVTRNLSIDKDYNSDKFNSGSVTEDTRQQNITNSGFFIEKAEIEVNNSKGKQKFIANIRFEPPDKYLISLKSKSGIEGARIYLSDDTILVNDRINQTEYYGTPYYLKKKYGFSISTLPLIFGDLVLEKNFKDRSEGCSEGILKLKCEVKGVALNYSVDCKKRKVIMVNQINNIANPEIKIMYDGFHNLKDILVPGIIEVEEYQYNTAIKIRVLKVERPWNGNIGFIPGKGYKLIELL